MVCVVKAQFDVDKVLWGKVRIAALGEGKTIGDLLGPVLDKEFGHTRERSSVASSSKSGVTRRAAMEEKDDGSARPVQQTGDAINGGSTPSTGATLKDGHGWCKGCGVNQVKLPAFLCKECRVEAGEDL